MIRFVPIALALVAAPAAAQRIDLPPAPEADTRALDRVADALSDPARQAELAGTLAVMAEILLDLPLAPMLEPLAEIAGNDAPRVDRDATLRKIAPGAGAVSGQIQDKLPKAMDSMASMSGAMASMMPALRDMAARLEKALPVGPPTRD